MGWIFIYEKKIEIVWNDNEEWAEFFNKNNMD